MARSHDARIEVTLPKARLAAIYPEISWSAFEEKRRGQTIGSNSVSTEVL